ncbi:hypothetical protein BDB01DRAFT_777647 [Pilobolus umbonatus]|nr:hypothetical protein BDB01DRAFT_777647 [Pilobolus umbonatus]
MLVKPGEILEYDYRDGSSKCDSLKVLQWNIERNYESEAIIQTLKDLDADIMILQEIDIFCRRSGNRNHMEELCRELKVKGGFLCEFEELDSPLRSIRDAGGGLHGNAILSKHDVDFRVLHHRRHYYNWERDGHLLNEPRKGQRATLVGLVRPDSLPPVLCYSVHLEVFTGIIGRVDNFSDILQDAYENHIEFPHQIIGGDMNTMGHSIARLSPKYARDRYRWMSVGHTESSWFDRHVMSVYRQGINRVLPSCGLPACMTEFLWKQAPWLLVKLSGFSLDILQRASNPGFYDPWDPDEVTLHSPDYGGLFSAKLDWTMLRCMDTNQKWIGNRDYSASDHAYLMVKVTPDDEEKVQNVKQVWESRRSQWQHSYYVPYFFLLILTLIALMTYL